MACQYDTRTQYIRNATNISKQAKRNKDDKKLWKIRQKIVSWDFLNSDTNLENQGKI